jgi:hypothetical protein
VVVASSGWNQEGWIVIPNGSVLVASKTKVNILLF